MQVLLILLIPLIVPNLKPKIFQGIHTIFFSSISALLKAAWRWPNMQQKKHLGDEEVAEEQEWDCPGCFCGR